MTFATTRLGRARQARFMSVRVLAEKLNEQGLAVNFNRITHIEQGRVRATEEEKKAIAEMLGIAPWEVFND